MAAVSSPNQYQLISQHISAVAPASTSLCQTAFLEALDDAYKQARATKNPSKSLHRLDELTDEQSLLQKLKQDLEKSPNFGPDAGEQWDKRIAALPGRFPHFGSLAAAATEFGMPLLLTIFRAVANMRDPIAKPIWGCVTFIILVLEQFEAVAEQLSTFQYQADTAIGRFNEYFRARHHDAGQPFRKALRVFYGVVIKFYLHTASLIKSSRFAFWPTILVRSDAEKLQQLNQKLECAVKEAGEAVNADTNKLVHEMKIHQQTAASQPVITRGNQMPVRLHSLGRPSQTFVGRDAFLSDLVQMLKSQRRDGVAQAALWGTPGVGKSQTALQYALLNTAPAPAAMYQHAAFIPGHDESATSVAIKGLVVELRLFDDAALPMLDTKTACSRFKAWLAEKDDWLLILDNVSETSSILNFLPSTARGHVLYTTRSEFSAGTRVTSKELAIELKPLKQIHGIELVNALSARTTINVSATDEDSIQIYDFTGGLPLAIEQIVQLAAYQRETLATVLRSITSKRDFLKRHHPSSSHEDGLSMGAIVHATLEALQKRSLQAAALFKVMCYLQPANIPLAVLLTPVGHMDEFFAREHTYTRGTIRTPARIIAHADAAPADKFCLWDYNPWDRALYSDVAHALNAYAHQRRLKLPRGDSTRDIALQQQWQTNPNDPLRHVFSHRTQLEASLNHIRTLGLAHEPNPDTLCIHDLIASLTVSYITTIESPQAHALTAHLAATTVFLAFPSAPVIFAQSAERCIALLPHALSTLSHLRDAKIEADVAVGPELSYLAGCAVWLRGFYSVFEDAGRSAAGEGELGGERDVGSSTREATRQAAGLYVEAYRGYRAAEQLVMRELARKHGSKGVLERLRRAIRADWEGEDRMQMQMLGEGGAGRSYSPGRHGGMREFERFGGTPTRRKIDAAFKIGVMYADLRDVERARKWLLLARQGYIMFFGERHVETVAVMMALARLEERCGEWEGALGWFESVFWAVQAAEGQGEWEGERRDKIARQMDLLREMVRCWEGMGRWREGAVALEVVFDWCRTDQGAWPGCAVSVARDAAELLARWNRWEWAVGWWCWFWVLLLCEREGMSDEVVEIDVERTGWWLRGDDEWRGGAMGDLEEAYARFHECLDKCRAEPLVDDESGCVQPEDPTYRHHGRRLRLQQLSDKVTADVETWMTRLRELQAEKAAKEARDGDEMALIEARDFAARILQEGRESGLDAVGCRGR